MVTNVGQNPVWGSCWNTVKMYEHSEKPMVEHSENDRNEKDAVGNDRNTVKNV